MKRVINSLNYDYTLNPGEVNTLPSQTIPDQSMSLRELLDRHARGLPLLGREPIYHGEDMEMPNLATLDLAEQQQMREELREYTKLQRDKLTEQLAERKKRFAEEAEAKKKQQWADFQQWQQTKDSQKTVAND